MNGIIKNSPVAKCAMILLLLLVAVAALTEPASANRWTADSAIALGKVDVCTSAKTGHWKIRNDSSVTMTVTGVSYSPPPSSSWASFYPPFDTITNRDISPSDSLTFDSIVFHPQAIGIPVSMSNDSFKVTMQYKIGGGSTQSATFAYVVGRGCAGVLSSPNALDFSEVNVGTNTTKNDTVRNTGGCQLSLGPGTAAQLLHGTVFSITSSVAPVTLDSNQIRVFTIRFAPNSIGSFTDTLTISHDGVTSASAPFNCGEDKIITLTGIGVDTDGPTLDSVVQDSTNDRTLYVTAHDDSSGVKSVQARVRRGGNNGSGVNTAVASTVVSGTGATQWMVTIGTGGIQTNVLKRYGMECQFTIADSSDNTTQTKWFSFPGRFEEKYQNITRSSWVGSADTLWHLVSIPGNLSAPSVQSIFVDQSGFSATAGNGQDGWRLYRHVAGQLNVYQTLNSSNAGNVVSAGESYWFKALESFDSVYLPAGKTVLTDTFFNISLTTGWNFIANPYFFNVSIDTQATGTTINSLSSANAAHSDSSNWVVSWDLTDSLVPWRGYMVYATGPGVLKLNPHDPGTPTPTLGIQGGWVTTIDAASAGRAMGQITIGTSPLSSDEEDYQDRHPLPLFGAKIPALASVTHGTHLQADVRSVTGLQTWTIALDHQPNATVNELRWSMPVGLDSSMAAVLVDVASGDVVDLTAADHYLIPNPTQQAEDRIRILAGPRGDVQFAVNGSRPPRPDRFRLYPNYPNPFNPSTTIAFDLPTTSQVKLNIYNLLGQRVRELLDEVRLPGSYTVEWNGRDAGGRVLASGVYFAKLSVSDESETIRMMLVK